MSATKLYLALEPEVAPDSHSPSLGTLPDPASTCHALTKDTGGTLPPTNTTIADKLTDLAPCILELYSREAQLSQSIAAAGKLSPINPTDQVVLNGLVALSGLADAVAKDLYGYQSRINELPALDAVQRSWADPRTSSAPDGSDG